MKKTLCLLLIPALLAVSLAACSAKTYKISFDREYDDVVFAPKTARAGETVEIRTCVICDADIHMFADGERMEMTHHDSDYWAYTFVMPAHDVTVSLTFPGGKSADFWQDTEEPEAQDGGSEMETVSAVSTGDWLPNWPCAEGGMDACAEVTPEMMTEYIDALKGEGFTLIGGRWSKLLYRDDVWISISDNTQSYNSASVAVTLGLPSGGMSAEEAGTVIGRAGMSEGPLALIEITPTGLYDETGMQIFKALYGEPPGEDLLDPLFEVKTFIVGGNAAHELSLMDAVPADMDGDEKSEAVVLEYGPTSGLCSIVLSVFRLENGAAVRTASTMYVLDHNGFYLNAVDGRPFLRVGGKDYSIALRDGGVIIDDPGNALGVRR